MATIISLLSDGGVFEPKDIRGMSMALEDVCKALNLPNGGHPTSEVIAAKIIGLARQGVRSPTVLRDRVLQEAGFAEYVSIDVSREA